MVPPYNVLISGSTKGIGYALAKEFLKSGDKVIICSRSNERVKSALETYRGNQVSRKQHVWLKCEVDMWHLFILCETLEVMFQIVCSYPIFGMMKINSAGSNVYSYKPLMEASDEDLIFAAYGATKRSVVHLQNHYRQVELRMLDVRNVIVHSLSPGMVTTDLLMSGANTKQAKFFIDVLAEPAEEVANYLVPNIRSIPTSGSGKPTYVS